MSTDEYFHCTNESLVYKKHLNMIEFASWMIFILDLTKNQS